MIFFTSDTHFWHYNIIQYCNRPVPDGEVQEMNEIMIDNWNSRVKPSDEIYHLGDFAFCGSEKKKDIIRRLNGIKYLIRGNHDPKDNAWWITAGFEWVRDYYVLAVHDVYQSEEDETKFQQYHQPIVLCHFPILSWDGMVNGTWHFHGHCHGSIDDTWNKTGLRMDVGVDTNNLYPYSYDEIKQRMVMRSIVPTDHHNGKK